MISGNGSAHDPEAPPAGSVVAPGSSDAHVAIYIIAGVVVMFVIGFVLLVVAMASDWA